MVTDRRSTQPDIPEPSQGRVVIEGVSPEIDAGRFPIKRVVGEVVVVEADIFTDGHDEIGAVLRWRPEGASDWEEAPFRLLGNDRWRAEFTVTALGRYRYTIEAWHDPFASWRRDLAKKHDAGLVTETDIQVGLALLDATAGRAGTRDKGQLAEYREQLAGGDRDIDDRATLAADAALAALVARYPERNDATPYDRELVVVVDGERACFGTWYEMFPRSCTDDPHRHGTFRDCENRLPYIADMGFDVLYLPPIHPIAKSRRRGKNNTAVSGPDDVGSPWAIGSSEGGHTAIHPDLGTLADFRRLVDRARNLGVDVALDLAYQCSPEHPWVTEHPEWFRQRPDGTIQYAENPPKKYEDIYPLDFDTADWRGLWDALKGVVDFWIDQGVRIFRVDNPHTKPFAFWEWMIGEVKRDHPDTIFLAEAFTRPKVMYRLAKTGFTQSYTYFAWRNARWELEQYMTELTRTQVAEYFRPNFWPNTPDILTEFLQTGGRSAFLIRLVLAATLTASYGIYGPAFELCESTAVRAGSEEYLDSEKYQIRVRDLDAPVSLREFIARVNRIRRDHAALQRNDTLAFHPVDNERIICYSKRSASGDEAILVVVNLDPHYTQSGWIDVPPETSGLDPEQPYQVHDLIGDARYMWQGGHNFVQLDPHVSPAHIFRVRRRMRTEQDFEYFL